MVKTTKNTNSPLPVIHSLTTWLPVTANWIHTQIACLPPTIQTHILCEQTANTDQYPHPNIHVFPQISRPRFFLRYGLRNMSLRRRPAFVRCLTRRHNARILHSHFGFEGWKNCRAAQAAGLKHVVTFYGVDVNRLPRCEPIWRDRYHTLFAHADAVLCEGPHMARCVVALGCPQPKVHVHHLAVVLDKIPPRPRRWTPGQPLRVLLAASFREKKGFPYALEALGQFQHHLPLEITIIGDADSEPRSQQEKQTILTTIANHHLQPKVRLLGYQPHAVFLQEAYDHHIFLSPSVTADDGDTEGGAPVSIIETAASGMPVLATTHCDIPEVLPAGTGLLAPERDVPALLAHLRWLTDHPHHWPSLAQAARARIEKEFHPHTQAQRLANLYHQLTAS